MPREIKQACLLALALLMPVNSGCNNAEPTPESNQSQGIGDADTGTGGNGGALANGPLSPSDSGSAIQRQVENVSGRPSAPPTLLAPQGPPAGSNNPAGNNMVQGETDYLNRPFATMTPVESDDPATLVSHIAEIDQAIGDLVVAGTNEVVQKEFFIDAGLRLGQMKLQAGERLAAAETASDDQKKAGTMAQLIALSHMSGIGDVESAQKLESLARTLLDSDDVDLAHQSRVVLVGFELQELQNGLKADPNQLLAQIDGMFQRPEDRNFPEFMMLQQAQAVLVQMGFQDAASQIKSTIINEYQDAADPQLRGEAWLYATYGSQAVANFENASASVHSPQFAPSTLIAAARGLYEAFPMPSTLERLAASTADLEYRGHVDVSMQLADYVTQQLETLPDSVSAQIAQRMLDEHHARIGIVGKPLQLSNLTGLDGSPLNWSDYEGKVVLVDFWATWCVPCLREIPNIQSAYESLAPEGFEVLAVNMDEDPQTAAQFVAAKNWPWRNYYFEDQPGFQSAFANKTGITMIPFIVLVGKDGNVAAVHVRGEEIVPKVRELLGLETSLIP